MHIKLNPTSSAKCFAKNVFPQPGGPYSNIPFGIVTQAAGAAVRFYRFPGINHAVAGYMPQTVDKQVDFIERNVMRGSHECVDAKIVDPSLPTYKTENPNGLYDIQPDSVGTDASAFESIQ